MLKTPWKEWKDSAQNHYILFCFAPIVRKTPHILGFVPFKSRTFKPVRVSGLDVFDDVRLAFLYSLCDVGHIALHLLVVLGTIGCIRIVRILKAVCLYLLRLKQESCP